MLQTIIQLVSGALGGNVAGGLMKKLSLGPILNSVAGIVGGFGGGQLLGLLGLAPAAAGGTDLMSIISSILGGGVGGGVLMAIIGVIKKAFAKK